jgi:5-deoxy-5-amino-3-dehydroquinate synthase
MGTGLACPDAGASGSGTPWQLVEVPLAERGYVVRIGSGTRHALAEVIRDIGAARAVIVSARPRAWVPDPGVPFACTQAEDGEEAKTLATAERLCRHFAGFGLTRADCVVSCGGGTITDVVGFAAAIYHRGVAVVHLPTSLLAQVDASVGGKTAVNLPEGKNLAGAYWQPAAVLCDTDYLRTLPRREWLSGYGEIARCHFIGAGDLRGLTLIDQITASVRLKASVVARDERDGGLRHVLNYGHTLGHALEVATGFQLRHGEAVAIGTVFAGRLAGRLGRISQARVAEHAAVVAHYGLPATLPAGVRAEELIVLMQRDKKSRGGLAFVLDGPDGPELVPDVPVPAVEAALADMAGAPDMACPANMAKAEDEAG